jgi:uncharacterized membrane protein YidH (DUF202 family)
MNVLRRQWLSRYRFAQPWRRCFSSDETMVENTGSVARDHLANERTFLAWARTGLGFLALGIGIDSMQSQQVSLKLNKNNLQASALGCVGTGAGILVHATRRFYAVQRALLQGKFFLGHGSIMGITVLTSCLTLGAVAILTFDQSPGNETVPDEENVER